MFAHVENEVLRRFASEILDRRLPVIHFQIGAMPASITSENTVIARKVSAR